MFKKKIICFILLAALLGVVLVTPICAAWHPDADNSGFKVLNSFTLYGSYAGIGAPYTNPYEQDYSFQLQYNTSGQNGYTSTQLRFKLEYPDGTSLSSNTASADFLIDFDNYEADKYKCSLSFTAPRCYNYGYNAFTSASFDLSQCYWENYRSRSYNYVGNTTGSTVTYNIESNSPKIHLHLHMYCAGAWGTNCNWIWMSFTLNSFSCSKDGSTIADYEKKEAEDQSADNEQKQEQAENQMNGINNSFDSFTNSVGSLVSAIGSTDTTVSTLEFPAMYIPATTVTPRIELNNIQPIDFGSVINQIPPQLMTIAKAGCSIAIYFFAIREIVKIFSNVFGNREDNG